MIRLLIADDHEVVRSGLVALLADDDIEIIGSAATGAKTIELAHKLRPDVVLLDIRMPDTDGLSALEQLKRELPHLRVLILSTYDNPTYVSRALQLGASGYMLKGVGRDELLRSIRAAASGENAWSQADMRRVMGAMLAPRAEGEMDVPLTQREAEVLKHMATGLTNKQIARELHISVETVKEHVQHILRKIGVTDRTQAAVWAVREGLL
jgi:DNA-binding NarL/FixJ family response regulator